jgi:Integrase core domain
MEKRSHRRIRDLDVLTAFQGLVANEIGCARISMMARSTNAPFKGRIQKRKTNHLQIIKSACNARPVHTKVHGQATRRAKVGGRSSATTDGIAAMDLFLVPTISFRLLYGLLIMGHGRRHILWFGVTAHPTAEACGWEQAPRYLIRDRDGAYGEVFIRRLRSIGIRDRPTSPRSPWQNGYAERLIGSIRRECLDHVIVFSERHLRHLLLCYMKYYNGARTHLSLEKDAPVSRAVDRAGRILCRPILGGLHHQYGRI